MQDLIDTSLGRYTILELLGEGGMGAVYKASDTATTLDVALKVLHPHLVRREALQQRFLQEAQLAQRLDHPGIVRVHDMGQAGEWHYIVMDLILGTNLQQLLQSSQTANNWMPLNAAVALTHKVCAAMGYAHEQGIIHGDIKPSNILIARDPGGGSPHPVITDFGLAKSLVDPEATHIDVSKGTPTYMSPEAALGHSTDARSDVYALGVLLYELVVGQPPFRAETATEAARQHKEAALLPPSVTRPDIPIQIEQIILKALEKEPEQRFTNAEEMAIALEAALPSVVHMRSNVSNTVSGDTTGREASTIAEDLPTPVDDAADPAPPQDHTPVDNDSPEFAFPQEHTPVDDGQAFTFPQEHTPVDSGFGAAGETQVQFTVLVNTPALTVEPGNTVRGSMILLNQSPFADNVQIEVTGVPDNWLELPAPVQLLPNQQQSFRFSIHPPAEFKTRAGEYTLTVRVTSQSTPPLYEEAQIKLVVKAYSEFSSELQPTRIRPGQTAKIAVHNQGNAEETFTLQWTDPQGAIAFEPSYAQIDVPSGKTSVTEFQASLYQKRWIGKPANHTFSTQVRSGKGVTKISTGELVGRSLSPIWLILVPLILCLSSVFFFPELRDQLNKLPFLPTLYSPVPTAILKPPPWLLPSAELAQTAEARITESAIATPVNIATPIVTSSPIPTISVEDAIKDYYALIGQQAYEFSYPMVKHYKVGEKVQSLDEYTDGWKESGPATISEVVDVREAGDTATITLKLHYSKSDRHYTIRYHLKRDTELGSERFDYWLFVKGEFVED